MVNHFSLLVKFSFGVLLFVIVTSKQEYTDEKFEITGNSKTRSQEKCNCNCNNQFMNYGTWDYETPEQKFAKKKRSCLPLYGTNKRIMMLDSCESDDEPFAESCKNKGKDDPNLFVPVANPNKGVIYKNFYCARCNNDNDYESLLFWHIIFENWTGDILKAQLGELKHNSTDGNWTVHYRLDDSKQKVKKFLSVDVPDRLPSFLYNACDED